MSLFRAANGWVRPKKGPLTKICHTYPITMELGSYTLPNEDQINV